MKEIISKTIDILCINGECYANIIEEKEEHERTWYDKFYLWYRQNFTIIILILGCLLVASMIYYIWSKSNKGERKIVQTGGNTEAPPLSDKKPGIFSRAKSYVKDSKLGKSVANRRAGKKSASGAAFKKLRDMGDKTGVTTKGLSKKVSGVAKGIKEKGKAALSSGKAALKEAPGRIGDAISNNIQSFYTLLFSVGIVLGFAFFFMPTICMLVIGLLTYQITKNQVVSLVTQ